MPKLKTKKSFLKRIKITAKNKIMRRHQLGSGHLKRNKSKGALNQQIKGFEYFKGESKTLRKSIGL